MNVGVDVAAQHAQAAVVVINDGNQAAGAAEPQLTTTRIQRILHRLRIRRLVRF